MSFWNVAKRVIKESHVVLFICDARMPELSQNKEVEEYLEYLGKKYLMVFNKQDLVGKEQLGKLKKEYPGAYFVSGRDNIGIRELRRGLQILGKDLERDPLRVGVVGYPNVGKSSIINVLCRRAKTVVSSVAGTTKGLQYVKVGSLWIIDSPGVIDYYDRGGKLGIIGAKDPQKLRNPEQTACDILGYVMGHNHKALEDYAGGKLEGSDNFELLLDLGKKKGHLRKGGVVDERRIANQVIRDWQQGKLRV